MVHTPTYCTCLCTHHYPPYMLDKHPCCSIHPYTPYMLWWTPLHTLYSLYTPHAFVVHSHRYTLYIPWYTLLHTTCLGTYHYTPYMLWCTPLHTLYALIHSMCFCTHDYISYALIHTTLWLGTLHIFILPAKVNNHLLFISLYYTEQFNNSFTSIMVIPAHLSCF